MGGHNLRKDEVLKEVKDWLDRVWGQEFSSLTLHHTPGRRGQHPRLAAEERKTTTFPKCGDITRREGDL